MLKWEWITCFSVTKAFSAFEKHNKEFLITFFCNYKLFGLLKGDDYSLSIYFITNATDSVKDEFKMPAERLQHFNWIDSSSNIYLTM